MALFKTQIPYGQPSETAGNRISSPVFRSLAHAIPEEKKYVILDIGSACGPNIEFFSRFNCKLYIADAVDSLIRLKPGTEEDPVDLDAEIRTLLPYDGSERFDAVLLWDMVNYLDPEVCSALVSRLRSLVSHGAHLHAFVSALREIPDKPASFRIVSEEKMEYDVPPGPFHSGPQFTQRDIERLMPEFAVRRSVLLQSGMQEYLLVAR